MCFLLLLGERAKRQLTQSDCRKEKWGRVGAQTVNPATPRGTHVKGVCVCVCTYVHERVSTGHLPSLKEEETKRHQGIWPRPLGWWASNRARSGLKGLSPSTSPCHHPSPGSAKTKHTKELCQAFVSQEYDDNLKVDGRYSISQFHRTESGVWLTRSLASLFSGSPPAPPLGRF